MRIPGKVPSQQNLPGDQAVLLLPSGLLRLIRRAVPGPKKLEYFGNPATGAWWNPLRLCEFPLE